LLVLALIVVLSAVAWPTLSGTFTASKLSAAADDIQSNWADARMKAIEDGHPIAFRCLIGGADFSTSPYAMATENDESAPAEVTEAASLPFGKLNDGLKFSEVAAASALDSTDPGLRSNMRDSSEWSPPIIFYPDGQSSDALLSIVHEDGRAITVTLRGLTGISRKGAIGASGIPVER
jgi:Tfp pilus assembly protein FimT